MEETEVYDFDKVCRLCLLEKASMSRIFAKKKRSNTTPLPIRIMTCTSLEVYQGDGLPTHICPKCLWSVNQAFTFREQCESTNTRLLKYVHEMKLKGINTTVMVRPAVVDEDDDDQNENDVQEPTPLEFLDEQITISEQPLKFEDDDDDLVKREPADDDEDDKPISTLKNFSRSRRDTIEDNPAPLKPESPKVEDKMGEVEKSEREDVEDQAEDLGMTGDSVSDLETDPAAALVETEMREDVKAPTPEPAPPVQVVNIQPHMSVRRYLESEFSRDPSYSTHKKFFVVGSEYSKMKKKQRAPQDKPDTKANNRFGIEGWTADQYNNLLDMKPRRKYAPREKNLISNNSSPIIEQDGTKSKFRACTHCGKVVLGKNMGIHVKIHVGNKSHLCDICGKSFLYKKTLETHKRVHSGERPCVCKICDKTFRSSSRLSDHMSTHTGRKPFICEICAVAFRIKGHLKKHLRVHSGEKPYICTFCEKAFSDAWNMKCHLRIHTGEKPPHACPVCGQCFLRRNKMEEHCKLTHGEEYVLPRRQNVVQRLKNDLVEMNEELRAIHEREREDMIRQEAERQLLANHFESQRQELADHLAISVPMPLAMPVPAFPGNLPAGIFGLQ